MIATETRRCTVEVYRKLPPDDWRYQLIGGEIVMSPPPSFFQQIIVQNLSDLLSPYVRKSGLGWVRFAPLDFYLDDHNVFQPDILFISRERQAIIQPNGVNSAPDLVVEGLSPHTARYDLNAKRAAYARSGVRELWLVYPEAKQIEVFGLQENSDTPTATHSLGAVVLSTPFPELEL